MYTFIYTKDANSSGDRTGRASRRVTTVTPGSFTATGLDRFMPGSLRVRPIPTQNAFALYPTALIRQAVCPL